MNGKPGALTGYDCTECLNRGFIHVIRDDTVVLRECMCKPIRDSRRRIRKSGLGGLIEQCTFDSFMTSEPWQSSMKDLAQHFVEDTNGNWFYAGGQVGAGKTHLCTAIAGYLLGKGKETRYMLWRDEIVQLKANINDDIGYARLIGPLKTVDVLYIDDLFKTSQGKKPTDADVGIAFEILNYRYINQHLVTIISGERDMDELLEIDEAVGSRIYQRSKNYCVIIGKDPERNYRLKDTRKSRL